MAGCPEIQEKLYSFATGRCDEESAEAIRRHIADCPVCAEELAQVREVVRLTGLMPDVRPSRDLYPDVAERMRAHHFWLKVAGAAAAAAVIMIALVYSLATSYEPPEREEPVTQVTVPDKEKEQVADTKPEAGGKSPKDEEVVQVAEKEPEPEERIVKKEPEPAPEKKGPAPEKNEKVVDTPEPELEKHPEPAPQPEEIPVLATIGGVSGEVKVLRGGKPLEAGVLLNILPGDEIQTNSLGLARIDLAGGDYIYVNNNSQAVLSKEESEIVLKIQKGEVYLEKESEEGSLAVDTGFGRIRARRGRFNLEMFGSRKCLLQVYSGEVECCEASKGVCGRYEKDTRAWFQGGRRCQKGTRLRSNEGIRWAMKLKPPEGDEKPETDGPGDGKKDDPGAAPGIPPKADDPKKPGQGQKGDDPGGKVGPGPSPMPPPPGDGKHPGGKHGGPGQGGFPKSVR
jgi:ferric-dicitrate binding protein FerR (iron transport regulator)